MAFEKSYIGLSALLHSHAQLRKRGWHLEYCKWRPPRARKRYTDGYLITFTRKMERERDWASYYPAFGKLDPAPLKGRGRWYEYLIDALLWLKEQGVLPNGSDVHSLKPDLGLVYYNGYWWAEGDTYKHRQLLKAAGMVWYPPLKCWVRPARRLM